MPGSEVDMQMPLSSKAGRCAPTPSTTCSWASGSDAASPQALSLEEEESQDSGDIVMTEFELPPPVIPLEEKADEWDIGLGDSSEVWSIQARLPQLRVRTFRASPHASPPLSPTSPVDKLQQPRRRSKADESTATATRAQLREGATGVEDVLNRVRYDLLESKEMNCFKIMVDNVERPDLCRSHLLRGDCRYGSTCRYQHVVPLAWLSGSAPPLVSNGSHVPYVETLETSMLFHLLDSAPSQTARHALLQTVAFVLYKGEVVWSRHVGKNAAQQLWDSFLAKHGTVATGHHLPSPNAAELMMDWPGNVWERVLLHLQDPCVISGAAVAILCSCRGMHESSTLGETKLWQMLAKSATDWPSLPMTEENEEPLKCFTKLARQVKLYRLCWAACQSSPQKLTTPKQGPYLSPEQAMLDMPGSPKSETRRFHGPTVHVEVGFEVTSLRGNQHITVAASRRSNELRLFQSRGLGRLPTLRLDRRVDALDLVPENDVLVAGSVDGQLAIHALSDPKTSHRLTRYKPLVARESTGSQLLAGLHFLPGSGGTQVLAAARSQNCAQLWDVTTAAIVVESERLGHSGLVSCEVLDQQSSMLVSADGLVRLWDLRSPSLLKVADLPESSGYSSYDESQMVVSVNVGEPFACALLSSRALRWADLRAMRMTEVRPSTIWPTIFTEGAYPARLVMARHGLVAAWYDGPSAPIGCWFAGGPALVPINADHGNTAVSAAAMSLGGGAPPFAVALARPSRRRRRLVYEVCAAAL